jgi:metal-responsive CopG/Arc/MetJ family transcriptional regulator
MSRPPPLEPLARKTISIPESLWEEISEYRHNERIGSEAEAIRRLLQSGLRAETKKRGSK